MTLVVVVLVVLVGAGAVAGLRAGAHRPRGLASGMELVRTLSLAAARRKALFTRPSLPVRGRHAPAEVGIELCRVLWRRLYAALEDVVLIFAPPRSWKTGLLAAQISDAPSAGLCTSTRVDLWRLTHKVREERGPVWVLNPEGLGGDAGPGSNVRWDMVRGCDVPTEAIQRAGYILGGSPSGDNSGGSGDRGYWESNAARALRCYLMAACLSGASMHEVFEWGQSLSVRAPVTVLKKHPAAAPGWGDELENLQTQDAKPRGSIASTLTLALQFMSVPELAYAATPGPDGQSFRARDFIATDGWLYVIGTRRDYAPLTPFFSAFAGHIFETCKVVAGESPDGRVEPPFPFVLDEAPQTARLPLPRMSSECGGIGVPMVISVQGLDQLAEVWGEAGAGTIWTNAAVRMGLGGSAQQLQRLETLMGHRAQRTRRGDTERVPVMTAGEIGHLGEQENQALVFGKGRPTIGTVRPIWNRRPPRQRRPAATHPPTGPLAPVYPLAERRRRTTTTPTEETS